MMDLTGKTIRMNDGADISAGTEIGRGGQGICYSASHGRTGGRGVAKQYYAESREEFDAAKRRTEYLVNARLYELSPLFHSAPTTWHASREYGVVHFAPLAGGKSLEALIDDGWSPPLLDVLQLALAVTRGLVLLHEREFGHGDLQGNNLFIEVVGTVLRAVFIDFCNYYHPKMPAPQPCIGQELFLAPEQRLARDKGLPIPPPDLLTELFSLGVLLHQLILLRHPGHVGMDDPAAFQAAMTADVWADDPAYSGLKSLPGGYPPTVLNVSLQNLFRRLFATRRDDRASAKEWHSALVEAAESVFICPQPGCGGPVVIDRSKTVCPFCNRRYPGLNIVTAGGKVLPIESGGRRVGRNDLGGAQTVSNHHANFERFGPEVRLVNFGRNGTFRFADGRWVRLPDGVPVALSAGDRLRFADAAEVSLRQAD